MKRIEFFKIYFFGQAIFLFFFFEMSINMDFVKITFSKLNRRGF